MEKVVMSVKEVAKYLGVSATTIYTMVRKSEIPHIKIRGAIKFNKDVIADWTKGNYEKHQNH